MSWAEMLNWKTIILSPVLHSLFWLTKYIIGWIHTPSKENNDFFKNLYSNWNGKKVCLILKKNVFLSSLSWYLFKLTPRHNYTFVGENMKIVPHMIWHRQSECHECLNMITLSILNVIKRWHFAGFASCIVCSVTLA